MRQNNINLVIENLIKSDILLLRNNIDTLYLNKIINADHLITSLKQFTLILRRYFKKGNKRIVLVVKNKDEKFFIDNCLSRLKLNSVVRSVIKLKDLPITVSNKKLVILLDDTISSSDLENFVKINIAKKNYFLFNATANLTQDKYGIYTIFAQMNSLKKILFLLLLIKRVLKIKNAIIKKI